MFYFVFMDYSHCWKHFDLPNQWRETALWLQQFLVLIVFTEVQFDTLYYIGMVYMYTWSTLLISISVLHVFELYLFPFFFFSKHSGPLFVARAEELKAAFEFGHDFNVTISNKVCILRDIDYGNKFYVLLNWEIFFSCYKNQGINCFEYVHRFSFYTTILLDIKEGLV